MKSLLKQFIRTKRLSVGISETPNEHLIQSLKQSDEDIKAGRTVSFKNAKNALSYIDSSITDDKRITKRRIEFSPIFIKRLASAPVEIKRAFREALELFSESPSHAALRSHLLTKKIRRN